jgi:hypothetical protein
MPERLREPRLQRIHWFRTPFRFGSVAPASNLGITRIDSASSVEAIMLTNGKLSIWNGLKSVNILTEVFQFVAETNYVIEQKLLVAAAGNGTYSLKIYSATGTVLYSSGDLSVEVGNSAIVRYSPGHYGTEANADVYVSHTAINDSSGAAQNGAPGYAKVVELKPVEDSTRSAGWLVPGGASTNLWKALDNRPPEGVADTNLVASAEKQIRDIENNATDNFIALMAAYSTALGSGGGGIVAGDTIQLTQAKARGGNSTTTTRNLSVRSESNPGPDASETTQATGATAAGTDPTGWTTFFGPVTYSPSVTLATKPGVRVGKRTASVNAALFDMLGLIVEYVPAAATKSPPFAPRTARNTLLRR